MHLHHLALGTSSVDVLAKFYEDVFRLKERARQSDDKGLRSIWLELDPGILMVERLDREKNRASFDEKGMHGGIFLIAFEINDEEREAVEKKIEEKGGSIDNRTAFTTYAKDPDGNRIAISSHSLRL